MKKLITLSLAMCVASASSFSVLADVTEKLKNAMASDIRSESETDRDANRMPLETIAFFGLEDDMKVLELIPGGGWYTKLLAPVLSEKGQYYASMGTTNIEKNLLTQSGFEKVKVIAKDARLFREEGARFYSVEMTDFGVTDLDMVLTFRNYHNFGEQGRKAMNEASFKALKPGGIYGVVDHTTRHNEPANDANRRRVDPVLAIKEILDAGFEFVDYSDLHYREVDDLTLEVGDDKVTGQTDRWTMKFRKPK